MTKIRKLSQNVINLIAAGEVIERPASVVKELVENAIDAGASVIEVWLEQGGKNLIIVSDNGYGMCKEDLWNSVDHHTTSKLKEEDLSNITSFGFRGEAMSSIAQVSRLNIVSKEANSTYAYELSISANSKKSIKPSNYKTGTKISVRDLFFTTPARLKFLKTDKTEETNSIDSIRKIAIAYPKISFSCYLNNKMAFKLKSYPKEDKFTGLKFRINDILGDEFIKNSVLLDNQQNDIIKIYGFIAIPTLNRSSNYQQMFYVNNKYVKDKLFFAASKIAYQDFVPKGRYSPLILFAEVPTYFVDVNAHPTKTEVRFRDGNLLRMIITNSIKEGINKSGYRTIDQSNLLFNKLSVEQPKVSNYQSNETNLVNNYQATTYQQSSIRTSEEHKNLKDDDSKYYSPSLVSSSFHNKDVKDNESIPNEAYPLGSAIAQVNDTYIISKTQNTLIIIDQHAAHERIIYEKLKSQFDKREILQQPLLMPLKIELDNKRQSILVENKKNFEKIGITFSSLGTKSIVVHAVPQLIAKSDIVKLIHDLSDDVISMQDNFSFFALKEKILETYACHHSIRAGRVLNIKEMNDLLRQIETVKNSGQCNHGRPVYVELKIKDIAKLLGR